MIASTAQLERRGQPPASSGAGQHAPLSQVADEILEHMRFKDNIYQYIILTSAQSSAGDLSRSPRSARRDRRPPAAARVIASAATPSRRDVTRDRDKRLLGLRGLLSVRHAHI